MVSFTVGASALGFGLSGAIVALYALYAGCRMGLGKTQCPLLVGWLMIIEMIIGDYYPKWIGD